MALDGTLIQLDLLLPFIAGLATVSSPCALPFAPVILTYYVQDQRSTLGSVMGGIAVLGGLVTFALPFGLIVSLTGIWITPAGITPYFEAFAGIVLLVFGRLTIFNVKIPIFFPTPTLRQDRSYRTLYTLGFLYGLAGIGCTVWPFLSVGMLATRSAFSTSLVYGIYVATVAAPILVMSFFAAEVRDLVVQWVARYTLWIRTLAGGALLAAGVYLLVFGLTFDDGSRDNPDELIISSIDCQIDIVTCQLWLSLGAKVR